MPQGMPSTGIRGLPHLPTAIAKSTRDVAPPWARTWVRAPRSGVVVGYRYATGRGWQLALAYNYPPRRRDDRARLSTPSRRLVISVIFE